MQQSVEPENSKKPDWKDRKMIDKIGVNFKFDGCKKYFQDDKESRNCYLVSVKNKKKETSFTYGDSIADTEAKLKPKKRDILELLTSDWYINKKNYPNYENDFAPEFGYDPDSIKGLRIYDKCMEFGEKLQHVFSEDDMIKLREELDDA